MSTSKNDNLNQYLDQIQAPDGSSRGAGLSAYLDQLDSQPPKPDTSEKSTGALRTAGDMVVKGAQGVVDLGASAVGLGSLLTGGLVGRGMSAVGYDPQRTKDALGEYLSDGQKTADKRVSDAEGFWGTVAEAAQSPRFIAGALMQSLPGILAMGGAQGAAARMVASRAALATTEGAAAAAGKTGAAAINAALATQAGKSAATQAVEASAGKFIAVGAGAEGAQTAGGIAQEAQQAGRDWSEYAPGAVAAGVGTGTIGLAAGRVMGDAATKIFTGAPTKLTGSRVAAALKSGVSEGVLEEMPQSAQEEFFKNIAKGEDDIFKGVDKAAGTGLVTGSAMGLSLGGLSGGSSSQVNPLAKQLDDQIAKGNSPLSRATVASTPDLKVDPFTQRANEVKVAMQNGGLQTLREIGPQHVEDFLSAIQVAGDTRAPATARQEAVDTLNMGMQWMADGQTADQPATGSPYSTELTVPPGVAGFEAPAQDALTQDQRTVDGETTEVNEKQIGGPRALPGPQATPEQPAPAGFFTPEDSTSAAPSNPDMGNPMSAETVESVDFSDAKSTSPNEGIADVPQAPVAQQAAPQGSQPPAAPAVARKPVTAPKVIALPESADNAGTAQVRKRKAQLAAMAATGFTEVERRPDGFFLVNPTKQEEMRLDNPGDAQMARAAIAKTPATLSPTTGASNGQNGGAAGAGLDSGGDGEPGDAATIAGGRTEPLRAAQRGPGTPGGTTQVQGAGNPEPEGVERVAAGNDARLKASSLALRSLRSQLTQRLTGELNPTKAADLKEKISKLPTLGRPPAEVMQSFAVMANAWEQLNGGEIPTAYWDEGPAAADGFEQFGNTHVNLANPDMALQWTMAHEADHAQEKTASPKEEALRDELWSHVTENGRRIFFEGFKFKGKSYASATPEQLATLKSEMLAEFQGGRWTDAEWLGELGRKKPFLFGQFLAEWIPTLTRTIDALKSRYGIGEDSPKNVDKFMKNLVRAKEIAMEIAILWAEKNQSLAQKAGLGEAIKTSQPGGAQYSARTDAEQEYRDVVAELKDGKTWLRTPNGEPTKLTERQWVQIRTPSFLKWFGDWRSGNIWGRDDVSKAVGADGEPVVVYHGTDKGGFMSFNKPSGSRRGDLGIFTTDNPAMARSYVRKGRPQALNPALGVKPDLTFTTSQQAIDYLTEAMGEDPREKFGYADENEYIGLAQDIASEVTPNEDRFSTVYAAFVNLRNPNEEDFEGALWSGSREHQWTVQVGGETQYKDGKQYFEEQEARAFAKEFADPDDEYEGADFMVAAEEHWQTTDGVVREGLEYKNDGTIIRQVVDDGGGPGYDLAPSDVFVAFKPSQLKSADFNTGEFGASDDIRYSEKTKPIKDESKVGNLTSVAQRGARIMGTRAAFSPAEKQAIKDSSEKIGVSEREITAVVRGHKLAHPTAQGWAPLIFANAKIEVDDKGKRKVSYNYESAPYTFSADAQSKQIEAGSPAYKKRVNAVAKAMTDEVRRVFQRSLDGDQNAKNILAQAGWYKAMRARLRQEFGGLGDLFADLLGATSPNTPVRDNWVNAVDSLRRASRGDYDALIPQWEAWADQVDALELDLRGWFNERLSEGLKKSEVKALPEYKVKTDALKIARKLDDALLPTKETGKKYGFNGKNVARAMVDLWRVVKNADVDIGRGGTAPKALNFSGNLIGFRTRATIDVWAARMLQRLAGGYRIPSMAETGVTGVMREDGTTTLQFGMGQDIFTEAANRIRADAELKTDPVFETVNDDDLQAVVWFIEKELWTVNNWTSAAGEGGSFELEASLTGSEDQARIKELRRIIDSSKSKPDAKAQARSELAKLERTVDRFVGGLSTQMSLDTQGVDFVPTDSDMARLGEQVRLAVYEGGGAAQVLASKTLSTQGRYGGIERSLDMEVVARQGYDAAPLWAEMLRQAQAAKQDSTFLSRVLRADEEIDLLRHRPGIEIYFREAASVEKLEVALADLAREGVEFLTVIVDGRRMPGAMTGAMAAAVGVRMQYVPEFEQRYGNDDFNGLDDQAISNKISDKAREMRMLAERISNSVKGVAFAGQFWHDTEVAFGHQYQEKINGLAISPAERGARGLGGEKWVGQSIRSGIEDANRQLREAARGESDGRPGSALDPDVRLSTRTSGDASRRPAGSGASDRQGVPQQPAEAGRGAGQGQGNSDRLTPLPGVPNVPGYHGPDSRLVDVAEQYARTIGIDLKRQSEFVQVDPQRAARIAQAYADMQHAPKNPRVKEAFANLIRQTKAQYDALVDAGYKFWFIDFDAPGNADYASTPWNAMRDVRENQAMGVFPTQDGFGSGNVISDNPLETTVMDFTWPSGGMDGPQKKVLANDLFRAVHDAFGHGLEGAGFRARGEENAWQAHRRLFTGSAVAAITSETRGQNSWVNYGPDGQGNQTASAQDTVFADQKTGLMPEWTWTEGLAGDVSYSARNNRENANDPTPPGRRGYLGAAELDRQRGAAPAVAAGADQLGASRTPDRAVRIQGAIHFGKQPGLSSLAGGSSGTGIRGAEQSRLQESQDSRIRQRVYFYLPVEGGIPQPESGLGSSVYMADLTGLYDPQSPDRAVKGSGNDFESSVLDAGYRGYINQEQGTAVVLGEDVPVKAIGSVSDHKVIPRRIERMIPAALTRTEGENLVRKPDATELLQLVKPARTAKIQASAPSFRMQYGSFIVNASEANAADEAIQEFSPTFRFSAVVFSIKDDEALQDKQDVLDELSDNEPIKPATESRYTGKKVLVPIKIEDTGEVAYLTMDVDRSIDQNDKRTANMLELLGCLT